jgi:nucleotide-binding universal stress UspA family protein
MSEQECLAKREKNFATCKMRGFEGEATLSIAEAMAGFLRSRGVEITVDRIQAAGPAGDQLMLAAYDNECDLIVAGAYGHSRLREWPWAA